MGSNAFNNMKKRRKIASPNLERQILLTERFASLADELHVTPLEMMDVADRLMITAVSVLAADNPQANMLQFVTSAADTLRRRMADAARGVRPVTGEA